MADNVTLPGTGEDVATDDVGGAQYQRVKLDAGGNGVSAPILAGQQDMADSLPVVIASDQGAVPTLGSLSVAATGTWTSATSTDTAVTLDVSGYASVIITGDSTSDISNGSGVFEFSDDGGTTWRALAVSLLPTGTSTAGRLKTAFDFFTDTITYRAPVAGFTHVRVRLTVAIVGGRSSVIRIVASTVPAADVIGVLIDPSTSLAVTVSNVTASNLNAAVVGAIASDSPIGTTRPVLVGARASAATPTDVSTDGDAVHVWARKSGAVVVDASTVAVPVTDNAGSLTVDNGGTFAVQAAINLAGTAVDGDSGVKSAGTIRVVLATDQPQLTNALKVDGSAAPQPVTDNSGSLTVDAPVATPVFVRLSDGAAAIIGQQAMAASLPVVFASNQSALTVDSELPAAAALADGASAVPTTVTVGSVGLVMNATSADRQRAVVAGLDSAGTGIAAAGLVGQLDDASTTAVTENQFAAVRISSRRALLVEGVASGTAQPISGTVTASNTAGDVAHDTGNSGNPVQIGVEAIAHGTNPGAVTAADRTKLYANRAGVLFVIGGHPNVLTLKHTTITTAVTDAAIITAGSGVKIVVTRLTVTLDNASTVFPTLLIGFGGTNTPTTTGVLAAHGGVPAGGGFTMGDGSGILGIGADNDDLRVTTTGNATGNGLQITVSYYTIES